MKRLATHVASGLLVFGLLGSALAAPHSTKMSGHMAPKMAPKMADHKMSGHKMANSGKSTQVTGTVLSLTPTSLTIEPTMKKMQGARRTFGISRSTTITRNGHPARLTALRRGDKAVVMLRGAVTISVRATAGPHIAVTPGHMTSNHKMTPKSKMMSHPKMKPAGRM